MVGLKKELDSIRVRGPLLAGGAKTASGAPHVGSVKVLTTPSATQKVVPTSQIHTTKPGSAKVLQSFPAKPGQTSLVTTQPATNVRTAATKSSKIAGTPNADSKALSTYLEFLQAHINQKGGSIKIVGKGQQAIQLVASAAGSTKQATITSSTPSIAASIPQVGTAALLATKPQVVKSGTGRSSPSAYSAKSGSGTSSPSVKVAKPGNTIVLPRHKLTMAEMEKSQLDSVVNKIMSNFSAQSSVAPPPTLVLAVNAQSSLTAPPPSSTGNKDELPSPTTTRLHLTKKMFASPQIILPEPTKKLPPVKLRDVPTALPTSANPVLSSAVSGQSKQTNVLRTAIPCTTSSIGRHTDATMPTPAKGCAIPSSTGMSVVPDTPPQTLLIESQNQVETPLPLSPIKSPVEQIIGEHSYPIITEPDKGQEIAESLS